MIDLTIIGGGKAAAECGDVLSRAGFQVRRALEIDDRDKSPIILGELTGASALARQAVEAGRHLLIASPLAFAPDRIAQLYENRKRSQALFVWSERRFHPGYRFVSSLIEADSTWRPRYLRQDTLSVEPTTNALMRWTLAESLSLALTFAPEEPLHLSASAIDNARRNAADLVSVTLAFNDLDAFVQVGLGEAIDRRETLIAAADRKAYVDELNQSMPIRLVEDEASVQSRSPARWLSCPSPTPEERARQQCLSFLDATLKTSLAQDEASLWLRSIAALDAVEISIAQNGAALEVATKAAEPRFRLIGGRSMSAHPPSVA